MITYRKNRNFLEFVKNGKVMASININNGQLIGVRGNPLVTMSKTVLEAKVEYSRGEVKNELWRNHQAEPNPALLIWDYIYRRADIFSRSLDDLYSWNQVMEYLPTVDRCAMLGLQIEGRIRPSEINLSAEYVAYYKQHCRGFISTTVKPEELKSITKYQTAPYFNEENRQSVQHISRRVHESLIQSVEVMVYLKGFSKFRGFQELIVGISDMAKKVGQVPVLEKDLVQTWVKYRNLEEQYDKELLIRPFGEHNPTNLAYTSRNGLYTFIPATCPQDLITEGERQSNCVGRGSYAEEIRNGNLHIVFVRKANEPETPYITCSIGARSRQISSYLKSHNNYNLNAEEVEIRNEYQAYLTGLRAE